MKNETREQKIANKAARRAKRSFRNLARVAAKYPAAAAYWQGSIGASVEADYADGRAQVIIAK